MSKWSDVERQLNVMVNQWYDTAEIKRMLAVPLNPAPARLPPRAYELLQQ